MKTNGPSDQAREIRAIRDEFGIGMMAARRAVQIGAERFDGNARLGALWLHADAFAVFIKGDRAAWNDSWARGRYEELKNGPESKPA